MDADVGLLQEVKKIPDDVVDRVGIGDQAHWDSHVWNSVKQGLYDRWPMVVKLSDRVHIDWFNQVSPVSYTQPDEIAVSGIGTIAAARVVPDQGQPFVVVSMYARWIRPHPIANSSWFAGFPDGSAHRIISDLSAFIGSTDPTTHRILAAGDLNTIFGATDDNYLALPARDRTITESDDGPGDGVSRAAIPGRATCGSYAPRIASGYEERAHIPHGSPIACDRAEPIGLRLRLPRIS